MDLSNITEQETIEYELLHPVDRTPLGPVFTLAGPEHTVRKDIAAQWARDLRRKINKSGRVRLDDPDDEAERELQFLTTATLGWVGVEVDGAELPFSEDAKRRLFTESRFAWVRRQLRNALGEQELFIRSSSNG